MVDCFKAVGYDIIPNLSYSFQDLIPLDGDGDCLIIEENEGLPPILVNASYVVWLEEGTTDE